jgi:hypothetical protein
MNKFFLAAAVLMASTGVMAAAPEAQEPQKEKKICRTERMTGSLTRRTRICMTEAQWRELAAQTKKGLDEMSRPQGGGVEPGPLGGG